MKKCKIHYLNLDNPLLFPRNQAICLKNWKLWQSQTTMKLNIFYWNFAHVSYWRRSTKACSGVIDRPVFCECVETKSFYILANNSRSKHNKKNPEQTFVDIGK